MIRRFFRDGLHWMVLVGLILGTALYFSVRAEAVQGDYVCGPDSGMFYDPVHGVCAPFAVAPPPNNTIYCYTLECLMVPPVESREG